jgi:hypothetical protein
LLGEGFTQVVESKPAAARVPTGDKDAAVRGVVVLGSIAGDELMRQEVLTFGEVFRPGIEAGDKVYVLHLEAMGDVVVDVIAMVVGGVTDEFPARGIASRGWA